MVRSNRVLNAFNAIGLFMLFQIAANASALAGPGYELAGLAMAERLSWFGHWITNWRAYANPFIFFFAYLSLIRWLLIDRHFKMGLIPSATYYASSGLYYGILFMNGLNGELHGKFDDAWGINPSAFVSAMFPLSIAFVLPVFVTLLVSLAYRRHQKSEPLAG